MPSPRPKSVRTRGQIVAAARKLFLKNGYAETSIDAVLKETGLSKGAFYHHYDSKRALLEAIYRDNSQGALDKAIAAIDPEEPYIEQLRTGAHAWLDQIRKPATAKILLELGPQGLGAREARAIEDGYSLTALQSMLEKAAKAGELSDFSPEIAARMLNALLAEAAVLAASKNRHRSEAVPLIDGFIDGLKRV